MTTHERFTAQDETTTLWARRLEVRNRKPIALDWAEPATAADGSLLLSARIDSPFAEHALLSFVREGPLVLSQVGVTQQPTFDYSNPGRTSCLWQTGGVWVELWYPESVFAAPAPAQAPPRPARLGLPSARLPFGRKNRAARTLATKEN